MLWHQYPSVIIKTQILNDTAETITITTKKKNHLPMVKCAYITWLQHLICFLHFFPVVLFFMSPPGLTSNLCDYVPQDITFTNLTAVTVNWPSPGIYQHKHNSPHSLPPPEPNCYYNYKHNYYGRKILLWHNMKAPFRTGIYQKAMFLITLISISDDDLATQKANIQVF